MTKKTNEELNQEQIVKVINEKENLEPPKFSQCTEYHRNELGLLQNVEYHFNEDKSIDWRKMVNRKYIVLNKDKAAQISAKYNQTLEELQNKIQNDENFDESDVDDSFKLLLLAGIKDLAKLRGFTSVTYQVISANPEFVAVQCVIEWIPNYETIDFVTFCSLADAHSNNTKNFAVNFLTTIAENRAFVRCVRNFLGIHIVGSDEMGDIKPNEDVPEIKTYSSTGPKAALVKKFEELKDQHKVSWATLQKYLVSEKALEKKEQMLEAENWNSIDEVPENKCYELMGIIGKIKLRKEAK